MKIPSQATTQDDNSTSNSPVHSCVLQQKSAWKFGENPLTKKGNRNQLKNLGIQPKLKVSQPGDRYEREADRVAEQVVRMPEPPTSVTDEPLSKIQRISSSSPAAAGDETNIPLPMGEGRPLSTATRTFMEPRLGYDFSQVRVHEGPRTELATTQLWAHAFTYGQDIWLGQSAKENDHKLIAHELAHVVQQHPNAQARIAAPYDSAKISQFSQKDLIFRQTPIFPAFEQKCKIQPNDPLLRDILNPPPPIHTGPSISAAPSPRAKTRSISWKPWIQDYTSSKNSAYTAVNIEPTTCRNFDTDWTRDAIGSAALVALDDLTLYRLTQAIPLKTISELLSIAGIAASSIATYENVQMEKRIRGKFVDFHEWYGKYRVNVFSSDKPIAVDFHGKGPPKTTIVAPYFYEERIVSDDGVLFTKTSEMYIPGISLSEPNFPEHSYGSFS